MKFETSYKFLVNGSDTRNESLQMKFDDEEKLSACISDDHKIQNKGNVAL